MIAKFDDFGRLEQPMLTLTNPEEIAINIIDDNYIENFIFNAKFNDVSEITFDLYKYDDEVYNNLLTRMRITVEGYGSWIISDVTRHDGGAGQSSYKSVTLKSPEYELHDTQIPYMDGTFKFYDPISPANTLMGMVMGQIPRWTINHIDGTIESLYRTFEVPESNVLSFLLEEVEDAYNCLLVFDGENFTISVYDKSLYVHYTDVLLTHDELIQSAELSSNEDTVITAMSVYGDNDLSINAVNPIGTSVIYNMSAVKSRMSEKLANMVEAWENEVSDAEEYISTLTEELGTLNEQLTAATTTEYSKKTLYEGLLKERDVMVTENADLTEVNSEIDAALKDYENSITSRKNIENSISAKKTEIDNLQLNLIPSNYFGNYYHGFLAYVYMSEYTNDNITVTENMTYAERIKQMKLLYSEVKDVLLQNVTMSDTYTIETGSFIFNEKFKAHTQSLQCGYLVGVENGINTGNISYYPITEFTANFADKSTSLTLGNKFNSSRAKDLFADLIHNVAANGRIVDYITSKKADSSELSDIQHFINSSLDLSKNSIISADGQTIEINDSGYHGRKLKSDGSLAGEEVAIINNMIAFTEDNWDTAKLALGKINLDGNTAYGLIADVLVGKFVLSENLKVTNSAATYTIDENGLVAKNSKGVTVAINPNDEDNAFYITNTKNEKLFTVSANGTLSINGYATQSTIDDSLSNYATQTYAKNQALSAGASTQLAIKNAMKNGTTTISGGCITTGVIASADKTVAIDVANSTVTMNGLSYKDGKLTLSGYETSGTASSAVSGLKTSLSNGTTTISGGCITTGVIASADKTVAIDVANSTVTMNGLSYKDGKLTLSGYETSGTASSAVSGLKTSLSNGTTTISGGCITTGTIDASKVTVTNLSANNITTGNINADRISGGTISGSAISLNSGQFAVDTAGNLTAKSGTIGGWTLADNTLKSGSITISPTLIAQNNGKWQLGDNGYAYFQCIQIGDYDSAGNKRADIVIGDKGINGNALTFGNAVFKFLQADNASIANLFAKQLKVGDSNVDVSWNALALYHVKSLSTSSITIQQVVFSYLGTPAVTGAQTTVYFAATGSGGSGGDNPILGRPSIAQYYYAI